MDNFTLLKQTFKQNQSFYLFQLTTGHPIVDIEIFIGYTIYVLLITALYLRISFV